MSRDDTDADCPENWGDDQLTHFFKLSNSNRYATFASRNTEVKLLINLCEAFHNFNSVRLNKSYRESVLHLIARAQLLFQSASESAFSGQLYPTLIICRACIESAAYAAAICKDPELGEVWARRMESEKQKKICRSSFSFNTLKDAIAWCAEDLQGEYNNFTEFVIDYGAHPNVSAIEINTANENIEDGFYVAQEGLTDNPDLILLALKSAFDAGIVVGKVMSHVYADTSAIIEFRRALHEVSDLHAELLHNLLSTKD